jgi:hypothetical protein
MESDIIAYFNMRLNAGLDIGISIETFQLWLMEKSCGSKGHESSHTTYRQHADDPNIESIAEYGRLLRLQLIS